MSITKFEDHFSKQARAYSKHRFGYPRELYEWLAQHCEERELAWDCACGSGQAALGLTEFFDSVIATDASADQIANAHQHDRVTYRICSAEQADIASQSADLVTIAQAAHWFDLRRFYAEVRRIVKPSGLIAMWCYVSPETEPEIAHAMTRLSKQILNDYWSTKVRIAEKKYGDLPFPFEELPSPLFYSVCQWKLDNLIGYLESWSATQAFMQANNSNPIEQVREQLEDAFGSPDTTKQFRWALPMRVGRLA